MSKKVKELQATLDAQAEAHQKYREATEAASAGIVPLLERNAEVVRNVARKLNYPLSKLGGYSWANHPGSLEVESAGYRKLHLVYVRDRSVRHTVDSWFVTASVREVAARIRRDIKVAKLQELYTEQRHLNQDIKNKEKALKDAEDALKDKRRSGSTLNGRIEKLRGGEAR